MSTSSNRENLSKHIPRPKESPPPVRLGLRTKSGRIYLVKVDEIDWIEADGNHLHLHIREEQLSFRATLQSIERRLYGTNMSRIHRSILVNVDRIEWIQPWHTGEYIVHLRSGKELTLTRLYRQSFFEQVEVHSRESATGTGVERTIFIKQPRK